MSSNAPSDYQVDFDKRAEKDLLKLDPYVARTIAQECHVLQKSPLTDPNIRHLYGSLYRLKVKDWRVVYTVESQTVTVVLVGHRKDAYRNLRRRET